MILSLFFTRGVSLETWVNQGLFDREKLIYEEHLKKGNLEKVYWLTYGSNDKKIINQLKKENKLHKSIEVLEMPNFFNVPKIGSYLYSLVLPFIYKKELKNSDILKTNQMDGSWSAVVSKWLYKKFLIVRTGYTLSLFEYQKNGDTFRYNIHKLMEKFAYQYCDKGVVASFQDKNYLIKQYNIKDEKIKVIPNFIDTNLFKPLNLKRFNDRILFVGRLNKQKNLFNLIKAISKTNLILDIYGKGELKDQLEQFAKEENAQVEFKGLVANSELSNIYNSYKYYILPSYFEGMPKTLLEAMACGCVCIGTNVNGINEVIIDRINGYLADDIDCKSLKYIIKNIIINQNDVMIKNAILTIENNFSLKQVIINESKIFQF